MFKFLMEKNGQLKHSKRNNNEMNNLKIRLKKNEAIFHLHGSYLTNHLNKLQQYTIIFLFLIIA